jgi:hypothetical protein
MLSVVAECNKEHMPVGCGNVTSTATSLLRACCGRLQLYACTPFKAEPRYEPNSDLSGQTQRRSRPPAVCCYSALCASALRVDAKLAARELAPAQQ